MIIGNGEINGEYYNWRYHYPNIGEVNGDSNG